MKKASQEASGNKVQKGITVISDAEQVTQVVSNNEAEQVLIKSESEPTVFIGKYKAVGRFGIVALVLVVIAYFLIRAFFTHTP